MKLVYLIILFNDDVRIDISVSLSFFKGTILVFLLYLQRLSALIQTSSSTSLWITPRYNRKFAAYAVLIVHCGRAGWRASFEMLCFNNLLRFGCLFHLLLYSLCFYDNNRVQGLIDFVYCVQDLICFFYCVQGLIDFLETVLDSRQVVQC